MFAIVVMWSTKIGDLVLVKPRQPIWRDFTTKKALTEAVRNVVNAVAFNDEFESQLLSDLIAERHWYCSCHQTRPTKFKKMPGWNGGYDFLGWFDQIGWHKVSWTKCITPDSVDAVLKRVLRTAIRPMIADYKSSHPVCERCQQRETEEVDHVSPTFDEMYRRAIDGLSGEEKDQIMASLNWNDESEFQLPEDHRVVERILTSHENCQLQAVCVDCHRANAKERKSDPN